MVSGQRKLAITAAAAAGRLPRLNCIGDVPALRLIIAATHGERPMRFKGYLFAALTTLFVLLCGIVAPVVQAQAGSTASDDDVTVVVSPKGVLT